MLYKMGMGYRMGAVRVQVVVGGGKTRKDVNWFRSYFFIVKARFFQCRLLVKKLQDLFLRARIARQQSAKKMKSVSDICSWPLNTLLWRLIDPIQKRTHF